MTSPFGGDLGGGVIFSLLRRTLLKSTRRRKALPCGNNGHCLAANELPCGKQRRQAFREAVI
ncbi:MAG: hypothetical protein AAFN10_16930 [Bacteroidota bacterium]